MRFNTILKLPNDSGTKDTEERRMKNDIATGGTGPDERDLHSGHCREDSCAE